MYELSFTFKKSAEQQVRVYIGSGVSNKLPEFLNILKPDKVFIVCNTNIEKLYAHKIKEQLAKKYEVYLIIHQPEEVNKNLDTIIGISNGFFAAGGTSKSCICALGGGVTGNIAGLFATLAFRGISLVHIPTTLLAQLDSAVDVKQSVNAAHIKNSLGAYKAPDFVVIDTDFLKTLTDRELRAGLGEAIKHGFSQDLDFVEYIASVNPRNLDALRYITTNTIALKIKHWKDTPTMWKDTFKVERLTHLGHTTGKILEMIDIDYLTHGEAISHGMIIEAYMSHKLGYLDMSSVKKMQSILQKMQLLYPLNAQYTAKPIITALYGSSGEPIFALLQELGNPDTISRTVPRKIARKSLDWYLETST